MTFKSCLFGVSLLAFIYQTEGCGIGWFGPKCQYKCRCSGNSCDSRGNCVNGTNCLVKWFGPGCQFVDIAYGKAVQSKITDGNHSTCGPSDGTSTVNVILEMPYPITWVRVHVRSTAAADILKASVILRDDSGIFSPTLKKSIVHETTVDIHIDTKWNSLVSKKFNEVRVIGLKVADVCSVEISGGRNVALKQPTSQSSTYTEGSISYGSEKAVDGNTDYKFNDGQTCSHTAEGKTEADWSITFSEPKMVNRYLLYNRRSYQERLSGFTLQGYQANGTKVVDYINSPATTESVYSVSFPGLGSAVSRVNIQMKKSEAFLTLCEVEIYGYSVCAAGYYGRDCEHVCNCAGGETCFASTGGCPSGCPDGYHGEACDLPCKPGEQGKHCNSTCSGFCLRELFNETYCDSLTGRCLHGCEEGYQGLNCTTPCSKGTYGRNCNNTCSKFCKAQSSSESICDPYDGWCLYGCEDGYQDMRCSTPCDPGMYGQNCRSKCSDFCLQKSFNESSCDPIDGRCFHGCISGYEGLRCLSRSIILTISGCFHT